MNPTKFVKLSKFEYKDEKRLKEIIKLNSDAAGERRKDYRKFIKWNIENPDDLYWKIVNEDNIMIGYIGFDDASRKPTTKNLSNTNDLFLEIYIHPEDTGKGYGQEAFSMAIEIIKEKRRYSFKVFASTYISNINAYKFFENKLNMKFLKFDENFGVNILVMNIINF